jgi:NitT/TauT family transport system permease protein
MAAITKVHPDDSLQQTRTRWSGSARTLYERLSTPIALVVFLIGWEILGRISNALFFPPFSAVVSTWWKMLSSGELARAMTVSLQALVVGYGLAVLLGVAVGTAMGLSRTVGYLLDIYVTTLMAAPLIALIPIIAIFFGLDVGARAVVVFLFSFFVITLNTDAGMQVADPQMKEMARSFCLSPWQIFVKITLPSAIPAVLAGMRLGIVRAVKGMVTSEMFMALTGLGALLEFYGSQFRPNELFAVLLTVIAFSMIVGAFVKLLDRRLTRWQRGPASE